MSETFLIPKNEKVDEKMLEHNKLAEIFDEEAEPTDDTTDMITENKETNNENENENENENQNEGENENENENKEEKKNENETILNESNEMDYETLSASCLQKGIVFGKCYEECELILLPQYPVAIPAGLEGFKRKIVDGQGLFVEGVFRLRGKDASLVTSKEMLNNGSRICDLQCTPIEMAQLLKTWFREVLCDDPGFISLKFLEAHTEEEIRKEFSELTEPKRSILLWVFDLWIEVEKNREKNKMTLQSMSIVFSPNLVRTNDTNPMIFLQYQKEAQRVLEIAAQLRQRGDLVFDTPSTPALLFDKNNQKPPPVRPAPPVPNNNPTDNSDFMSFLNKVCVVL